MSITALIASAKPFWPIAVGIFLVGGSAVRIETHISSHDAEVSKIEQKVDTLDLRLDNVEVRLAQIESEVSHLRENMDRMQADMATRFDKIEDLILQAHFNGRRE